jgi:tripartite-type tricarboxylate transporter receptor subunit TctC
MRFTFLWRLAVAAVCSLNAFGATAVRADETYPNRAIKLVVPYGAGGASDTMARMFAQKLSERIGQTVVIENQPAAAGLLAYTSVARSAPDGYTLAYGTSSLALNAVLKANASYDLVWDFAPVSMLVNVQNLLVVPSSRTETEPSFRANRALRRSARAWTAVEPTTGVVNTRIAAVRAGRLMST